MSINSDLMARLYAIQDAFANGFTSGAQLNNPNPAPAKAAGHWRDALQDDDDEDQGGGRGTAKGLRGKDAEHVKRMRKLTRTR